MNIFFISFYQVMGFTQPEAIHGSLDFSKKHLFQPAPEPDRYMDCFNDLFDHVTLSFSNELYRESILLKLLSILADHYTHLVLEYKQNKADFSSNAYVNLAIDYYAYQRNIGPCGI